MLGLIIPPALKKLLPYAIVVAAVLATLWVVDHRAYQRGWDTASAAQAAAAAAEAIRVADANKRAIQDAMRVIARLSQEKEARDAQIADLLREGATDPTAGSIALPPSSVRRLNSIN